MEQVAATRPVHAAATRVVHAAASRVVHAAATRAVHAAASAHNITQLWQQRRYDLTT